MRRRGADREACRQRCSGRRSSAQLRHGRVTSLAPSISRPLLQLHVAGAAPRGPMSANRRWSSGMLATEDWWSVWIGLAIFAASLVSLFGVDLVGWVARTRPWEWTDLTAEFEFGKLFAAAGASYAAWHPLVSWTTTYLVFT